MKKGFTSDVKNKHLLGLTCVFLLFAVAFLSFSVKSSDAQGSGPALQLTPSQGPPGAIVSVYGLGFPQGGSVSIDFGERHMTNSYPGMFGRINTAFSVPSVPYGTYTVTATGNGGVKTTATFVVSAISSSSSTGSAPIPTYGSSNQGSDFSGSFGFTSIPTQAPVKAKAGFWSPLAIGAVAVVIVIGVLFPTVFIIRRRRSSDIPIYEETHTQPSPYASNKPVYSPSSPYAKPSYGYSSGPYKTNLTFSQRKPAASSPYRPTSSYGNQVISQRPVTFHRYSPPASSTYASTTRSPTTSYRPGQPSGYSSFGSTKTCPRCKHTVKSDYSVCPYCHKKL